MVNIGTKNLHYLVNTHIVFTPRLWLETLQFFTAELPRAQARVSKQIGSRPGVKVGSLVTGRWLDNWFINPIHNRLIFPQPDACPEMRGKIHRKVLRYFFSRVLCWCPKSMRACYQDSLTNEGLGTYSLTILINLRHDLGYHKLTLILMHKAGNKQQNVLECVKYLLWSTPTFTIIILLIHYAICGRTILNYWKSKCQKQRCKPLLTWHRPRSGQSQD